MARSAVWTRNYDNLFSIAFGTSVGNSGSGVGRENPPVVRGYNGSYWTPYTDKNQPLGWEIMPSLTLGKPGRYITNGESYLAFGEWDNYRQLKGFGGYLWGIQLGSGEDEASYEDYVLRQPFTSDMTIGTISTISSTYDDATHKYTYGFKIPIVFSGSSVNVNEFGLYSSVVSGVGSAGTTVADSRQYLYPVLVYREVLDNTITLLQNDVIEITVTQTVQQPNYTPYPVG